MPATLSTSRSDWRAAATDLLAGRGRNRFEAAASLSSAERGERLEVLFRLKAAVEGEIALHLGETARSESFREEGATSTAAWTAERFGVSAATARSLVRVAERAPGMPTLVGSLCAGDISLDKVRAVATVAGPRSDRALAEAALGSTVRELAEMARGVAAERSEGRTGASGQYLRFNDTCRTMTVQLPADAYAETRACIDARTKALPDAPEATPLDERRCDGFLALIRSSSSPEKGGPAANPHLVVAHVPLEALVDQSGDATALAGELELGGLIDVETVKRVACDATIVVAVDDEAGHTMYEGRQQRFATDTQRREVWRRDRRCRFPGCENGQFTAVHHIREWKPGGRTDLPNLALLCQFHHMKVVHSRGWRMSGDANAELTFRAPNGRVMTSRPSPLWTHVPGSEVSDPSN